MSIMHYAAKSGDVKFVKMLLDAGTPVNILNKMGKTSLHLAAMNGQQNVVKLLLNCGANVDIKDHFNMTALHWACDRGYKEIVQELVQSNSSVSIFNNYNESALSLAEKNGHEEVVKYLNEILNKNRIDPSNNSEFEFVNNVKIRDDNVRKSQNATFSQRISSCKEPVFYNCNNVKQKSLCLKKMSKRLQTPYFNKPFKKSKIIAEDYTSNKPKTSHLNIQSVQNPPYFNKSCKNSQFVAEDGANNTTKASYLNVESVQNSTVLAKEEHSNNAGINTNIFTSHPVSNTESKINKKLNSATKNYPDSQDKLLFVLDDLEKNFTAENLDSELLSKLEKSLSVESPSLLLEMAVLTGKTIQFTEAGIMAMSMIKPVPFIVPHEERESGNESDSTEK